MTTLFRRSKEDSDTEPVPASSTAKQTLFSVINDCSTSMQSLLTRQQQSQWESGQSVAGSVQASGTPVRRIDALMHAMTQLIAQLMQDVVTRTSVQMSITKFGGNVRSTKFVPLDQVVPGDFTTADGTPLGSATNEALNQLESKSNQLNRLGTPLNKGVVTLFTDGQSTESVDVVTAAAARACEFNERDGAFLSLGFDESDCQQLRNSGFPNVKCIDGNFRTLIDIVSRSVASTSRSQEAFSWMDE